MSVVPFQRLVLPTSALLFCGRKRHVIKRLVPEKDAFLLQFPDDFPQRFSQTRAPSHSWSRRQRVADEGRAPSADLSSMSLRSTHKTPSKQLRSSPRLHPPFFRSFGFGMIGLILDQYLAASSDAWRLTEIPLSISCIVANACRAGVHI